MRVSTRTNNAEFQFDSARMDRNLQRAQNKLDQQILGDCLPFTPFLQGALRSSGHIVEPGLLEWNTPYAHYQYEGELYLTEDGRSWAHKYEKKYPTGVPLQYHEPGTSDHWFEKAKEEQLKNWIALVEREVAK